MNFDIDTWMKNYLEKLKSLFSVKLLFVGLQGSYGRSEADDESDIDVVVILSHVSAGDLKAYSTMLDSLPNRDKVCGFISGREELINWERSDLFQFYYDTTPLFGSIDFLLPLIGRDDVRRAVRIGACNIYHMCGHNLVHEKDCEILKALYKLAAFTIQAYYFDKTGTYIKKKDELIPLLPPREREILKNAVMLKQQPPVEHKEFECLSATLFSWAAALISEYKIE